MLTIGGRNGIDEFLRARRAFDPLLGLPTRLVCRDLSQLEPLASGELI